MRKYWLIALMLCLPSVLMAKTLAVEIPASMAVIQGTANANVRSGDSEHARIIRSIKPGSRFEVLAQSAQFTRIKIEDGSEGWVLNRLIKIETAASEIAVSEALPAVVLAPVKTLPPVPTVTTVATEQPLKTSTMYQTLLPYWKVLAVAAAVLFLLGLALGFGWREYDYRKKLNGLRI